MDFLIFYEQFPLPLYPHPFEDGNGRIARLMVNFILARHNLPMMVIRSYNKQYYLEALHKFDIRVGIVPSIGSEKWYVAITPSM